MKMTLEGCRVDIVAMMCGGCKLDCGQVDL